MTTERILTKFKILRPGEVVELAALTGLELAAAATLLQKESGGGRNVYGHDGVKTGGVYTKGGPVTPKNYRLYKANRKKNGAQGVGPTQLTWTGFQDEADRRGGCFDWRVNTRYGFEVLQNLIEVNGVRGGFRRYNGSGAAAEAYADDALDKLRRWRGRLAGHDMTQPAKARPDLVFGDTGPGVVKLQKFLNKTFPLYSHIDLGPGRYGPQTAGVIAEFQRRAGVTGKGVDLTGRRVGPRTWAALERFGLR